MLSDTKNLSQLKYGSISTCVGIIVDFTTPRCTKKEDYYQSISLVDPSTNGKIIKLMIFNSELNSFPNIKEKGDIMFCKNVKVQQFNDKVQLLSNLFSVFEVYPKNKKNNFGNEDSILDNYRNWWKENENKYNFKKTDTSHNWTRTISQINFNIKYCDIYCQIIHFNEYSRTDCTTILVTDYTENELLEEKAFHENPDINAKIYLTCTFWDENSHEIRKFSEGDFIFLKNIAIKNRNNLLEGTIHGNSDWAHLFILEEDDSHIKAINKNRETFIKNNLDFPSTPPSPKDKGKNAEQINKLIEDSLIISQGIGNLIKPDDSFMSNNDMTTSTPKKNTSMSTDLFISSPITNKNTSNMNANFYPMPIRKITKISHFNMPITKIKSILDSKEIPNRYRCRVRVVDFMPRKFENFTRPYCSICKKTFDKVKDKLLQCPRCKLIGDKIKFAFLFSFLVEDDSKKFLPIIIFEVEKSEFLGLPATSLSDPNDLNNLRMRLSKLWTFKTSNYYVNKEKTISHAKTILCGNFFDVCIERYKNSQGIRQKIFDTKLIV